MAARSLKAAFILEVIGRRFEMIGQLQQRLERLRGVAQRFAGVSLLGSALTFAGPVQQLAAYEDVLRQSVITQGMLGQEATRQVAIVSREYERLARVTGQRSQAIAEAASDLVAANLPREVIQQLMPLLGRTATATGASLQDLAKLAISLNQNLRVGPEGMTQAFASMAQAGMEGRFELRDMASEFPRLTAQAEGLGLTGQRAVTSLSAMLQIARRGAATSSEAANNLGNFLGKITAPETVKHFQEMGVNLPGLLADAARRGLNPVEAVIQRIRTITGGDMFKVGKLFGDVQVLNFLRPFISNVREYQRILRSASDANASLLDQSFETRWAGYLIQVNRASEGVDQFGRRLAVGVMPKIRTLLDGMDWLHDRIEELDTTYPGVIDGAIGWGATLLALAGALGLVATIALPVVKGFVMMGTVLKVLLAPFSWIMRVLMGFGVGASAAAAVAAFLATALVAAGVHIWRNWDRFRGFFAQLWAGVRGIFGGFADWVAGWFTGSQATRAAAVMRMWEGLKTFFGGLWGIVKALFTDFIDWIDGWSGGAATATGAAFGRIWEGLKDSFGQFGRWARDWIATELSALVERFKEPWAALTGWFTDLFQGIARVFNVIWAPIQAAIDAARAAMPTTEAEARANAQAGGTSRTVDAEGQPTAGPGRVGRVNASPGALIARQNVQVGGRIVVEAAPGTTVREVESATPGFTLAPVEPIGPMRGRP